MAIDAKSILTCLWKIVSFSMQICFKFVSENPVFSAVSLFFILLYMFSPTFFAFIIFSLLILTSAFGFYRVFLNGNDTTTTDIVKSYKKNDGDLSEKGTNGSISDHANNKNRKKFTRMSNIEDRNMVCSTRSRGDKDNEHGISQIDVGGDEGSKIYSGKKGSSETSEDSQEDRHEDELGCDEGSRIYCRKKESSETSEDWQEDRHEDEEKIVMDPGVSDVERNIRLETMIARRKARKFFSFQVRHKIMKAGKNDPVEHLASILVPRRNYLMSNNSFDNASPSSAPPVMVPVHNPFDLPYETHEERPNLTDESFQQEFLPEKKDLLVCRQASFSWGTLLALDPLRQDGRVTKDISFNLRAPQKLKNPIVTLQSHLENKNVAEVIEKETFQEKEAISNGCSAEDHATQEGQAAQHAISSQEDQAAQHEISTECEDKSDMPNKDLVDENIGVESSSPSSSEESLPICRPNKGAILRSIVSFRRIGKDDDYQVNGPTHDNDQTILNTIQSDDGFLYAARVMDDHARMNSLASDMLVEISEISSPRSITSIEEEYSGNEEVEEISSHPSRMDTSHESNSKEIAEINDQQDISGGVSRINHNAEALASDQLPEKVSEENSINSSDSLSSSRTGLPDSTQTHSMDSKIEDLPESSEKKNEGNIININLGDSETPINDDLKKSNTANNIDNGTPKQIIQPRDLPESSGGSNSNSVNHKDLSESLLQNRQNEKRDYIKDYNGESEYRPSQNILPDNPQSVQSNHSLRSPENRWNEEVVSEVEFPASSAENEASDVVSEIESEQVPNISSSGSSPKSVLQPKFSSDNVSSMDLSQGTSTEYQQAQRLIVDDDSVLPAVVDFNHSVFRNASPREDDSTSRPSHVIERLQSPGFVDALYCMPFRSRLEEHQNHDASITTSDSSFNQDVHVTERLQSPRFVDALYCMPFLSRSEERQNHDDSISTSASSFYQDINDPYPHQSNFNQEADTSIHIVNGNQVRTNLESFENTEGDNHSNASIEHSVLREPSNPSGSKSIEGTREINGQEGTFETSKSTEGNSEAGPDIKLELHEATLNELSNQPHEAEAKDSSVASKALSEVFDEKQTESSTDTDNLVAHVDIKEPSDPPIDNQEADTSIHIDNLVVNGNQVSTALESVENIEGDNHNEASIEQSVLMEASNPSTSKSIEETEEGTREINGQEGTFDTSRSTEGNSGSGPDIQLKELHEATLDDFSNQPHEAEAKDSSVASKALNAVLDQKKTESSTNTGNLLAHVDIREPSDPPLERTMEEANNSSAIQHDPEITKSDDGKSKSVKGDIGETFEHVIRPEDVHNSLKLDATSGSKSTAEAEGGLANYSEVEIKSDDHK